MKGGKYGKENRSTEEGRKGVNERDEKNERREAWLQQSSYRTWNKIRMKLQLVVQPTVCH